MVETTKPNARDVFYRERDLITDALSRGENPYGGYQNAVDSIYNTYGRDSGISFREVVGILAEAYPRDPSSSGGDITDTGGTTDAPSQTADQIGQLYDPIFADLARQGGFSREQKATQEGRIGRQFGSQKAEAERQKGVAEEKITREKGSALRDLEGNIRSAFQAGQVRLGGLGAGDSSAAQVNYPYALTKLSNQNRGMIQRTAMEQTGDIQETFQQGLAQLGMWRDGALNDISQQFNQIMNQLETQKANVSVQRQQDIMNLQQQLYQNALSQTNQVNQQAQQAAQQMTAQTQAPQVNVGTQQIQQQDPGLFSSLGNVFSRTGSGVVNSTFPSFARRNDEE